MIGHVHIIRTADVEQALYIDTQLDFIMALAVSPDGKLLAASGMDGKVAIFDITENETEDGSDEIKAVQKYSFEAHSLAVRALSFTYDSKNLVTGSDDHLIRIHSLDGKVPTTLDTMCGHGDWILSLQRSPDKRHVVSTSADHKVKVWDLLQRECVY